MKKKYIVPLSVVFAFLVLPGNILSGTDERNYYYDLGVSNYDEGKISEAISAWEKAIIVSPKFVEAYYNLGNAYEEKGLLKKAISAWEKVIEITPFDSDTYFNMGVAYTKRGMFGEAVKTFQKAIEINPDDPEAHYSLGIVYANTGELDNAIEEYNSTIELRPDHAAAYYSLGNAFYDKNMLDSALASYERAIEISGDYADAYNNMGSVLFDKGMIDEAIDAWEMAIAINPSLADAYYNLGNVYDEKRMFCRAVSEWRKALEVGPDTREKRLFYKAVSSWERALEINPDMTDARYNLAVAYTKNKMYKEAINEYKQILIKRPDDPEALFSLGVAYRDKGLINKAIAQFKRVLAVQPENTSALDNLGLIHFDTGHYDDAVSVYEKSLQIEPDNIDTLYNLGLAHYYKGDLDEAIIMWEKVASINPFYKDVQKNLSLEISTQRKQDINKVAGSITNVVKESHDEAPVHANKAVPQELIAISVDRNSKQKDVTNQQFVETTSRNDTPRQVRSIQPQPERNHSDRKDAFGQFGVGFGASPIEEKSSTEISTQKKLDIGKVVGNDKVKTEESLGVAKELESVFGFQLDLTETVRNITKVEISNNGETVPTHKVKTQEELKIKDDENDRKNVSDKENLNPVELARIDLGAVYAEKGMIDEAIPEFRDAIEINPDYAKHLVEQADLPSSPEILAQAGIHADNDALEKIHDSPESIADDNVEKEIDERETVSYNITRNYNTNIGYNEAIEKYEDAIRRNPYDNNANHSLAYAYYSKALHLDDAIAMREDTQESSQGFLIKRYYLYNIADDEEPGKISLTKQTEPFGRESVALHNRSGDVYLKKRMFNDAIFEYRNALEINPKCAKALYNLAFSFFIKGTHIDVALKPKKIRQTPHFN
jgi:tetratricopeptide (TPR) repeat protein